MNIRLEDWIADKGCDLGRIEVRGMLLRKYDLEADLALLDQDIAEVALPNRITIDVGWFPEHDARGRFVIRTYKNNRNQEVRFPIETTDPFEVASKVADIVREYCPPVERPVTLSCAQTANTPTVQLVSM